MIRKAFIILAGTLVLASSFSCTTTKKAASESKSKTQIKSTRYEVYPIPQNEAYFGTRFTITDEVNVVIEETIDQATRNFLYKIFDSKSLDVITSKEVVPSKTNVIIGTRDGEGAADAYFNKSITYNNTVFNELDAYVLAIHKKPGSNGTIAILGKDSDAAYYALATLRLIFKQIPEQKISSVKYEDFADTKYRGFIEGFYGIPWSYDDRESLMRFGGKFKMNIYIYAPKDDPYHSATWRTPYPEDELKHLAELVEIGHATKTKFVWAIHPGFNMIHWNSYETELDTLINKLEQLYSIGVRQFGLFMDDISLAKAVENQKLHVKLITDVANWAASKKGTGSLIYTPPFYNQYWTGEEGENYLRALQNVPENVEIMWTGRGVLGTVNPEDMRWVKKLIKQKPFVWLNWPVNDYVDARLLLGKGEVLKPNTHNIVGIVSNPMAQAELSKIALFAVADYTWNVDAFNTKQSWLHSFKYIAPHVSASLKTISRHMSSPQPNTYGFTFGESENIKKELQQFLKRFSNNKSITEAGHQLITEFENILEAIHLFRQEIQNTRMLNEIDPWLHALEYVVTADKNAVEAAIALQNGKRNITLQKLAEASYAMSRSDDFNRTLLDGSEVIVEAGAKTLVPFAESLINNLTSRVQSTLPKSQ